MSKPVLTYFDFPGGRGEEARIALHVAGVDFVDDRFRGDWPAKKPTTPFGALPVLEIPGKGLLTQSNAILGFIGRGHDLLPADSWEAARHEAILNVAEELRNETAKTGSKDEDEKRTKREAFTAGYLTSFAKNLEAQIAGPFFGGATLSVADIKLFVVLGAFTKGVYDHVPTDVFASYPKITGLLAAVAAHPRVADWYARSAT